VTVTFDDLGAWENPSNPWHWVWVLNGHVMADLDLYPLGNSTDNPGVFRSNPYPYPSKPVPASTGTGYRGVHGVSYPRMGLAMKNI